MSLKLLHDTVRILCLEQFVKLGIKLDDTAQVLKGSMSLPFSSPHCNIFHIIYLICSVPRGLRILIRPALNTLMRYTGMSRSLFLGRSWVCCTGLHMHMAVAIYRYTSEHRIIKKKQYHSLQNKCQDIFL